MVSYYSLINNKSPQVSRTLLSILADLNTSVIWMVSMSSSPFINPLVTVPSAPITIGITVTFIFHSFFFFQSSRKVLVHISLFAFFQFDPMVNRDGKIHDSAGFLLFFYCWPSLASYYYFRIFTRNRPGLYWNTWYQTIILQANNYRQMKKYNFF